MTVLFESFSLMILIYLLFSQIGKPILDRLSAWGWKRQGCEQGTRQMRAGMCNTIVEQSEKY